jgi:hypothetical protein
MISDECIVLFVIFPSSTINSSSTSQRHHTIRYVMRYEEDSEWNDCMMAHHIITIFFKYIFGMDSFIGVLLLYVYNIYMNVCGWVRFSKWTKITKKKIVRNTMLTISKCAHFDKRLFFSNSIVLLWKLNGLRWNGYETSIFLHVKYTYNMYAYIIHSMEFFLMDDMGEWWFPLYEYIQIFILNSMQ